MSHDAFDKVFDVVLNDAAKKVDRKLGNELEEYEGTINYSKRHNKRMKKLFKAERRKENRKQTVKTVLICVLMAFIIFVSLFAFCEPFRLKVLNTYLEVKENINFDFSFSNGSSASYKDEYIELGYVPEGFEVNKDKENTKQVFYKFKNNDKYFHISFKEKTSISSIDTEKGISHQVSINDNSGTYFSNYNLNSIIWNNNEKSIRVFGNIPKNQLIKIAENLKILK